MKKKILLFVFFVLVLAITARAQSDSFSMFQSPFMKAFGEFLTTPVQWPPLAEDKVPVAPLQIILVSIALFSIILAIVRTRIAIFQDDRVRHLATWLALPIVGMSITGTHFVPSIWGIVGFGSDITPIILFILLIIFAVTLSVRGIGAAGIRGGPVGQAVGERIREGAERAANVVRTQAHREENQIAQEAQRFQQVDNLEGAGIRDAAALEGYLGAIINLLGGGHGIREIVQGIDERLGRLNTAFANLVAVNARAVALDAKLNTDITTETRRLERSMLGSRTRRLAMPGVVAASIPMDTEIRAYTADLSRRLQDARATGLNLAANGRRLTGLETDIRRALDTALTTLRNPGIPFPQRARTARTELITARSLVSELITIMHNIENEERRIRQDLMRELTDLNAEEHLARV